MNLYTIWIDHAKAIVVKANEEGEMSLEELETGVSAHSGAGRSDGEHLTLSDQRSRNESRANETHHFCKKLVEKLHDADEIIICGPGNAKHDLKNCIEETPDLAEKLNAVETTHPLSEAELKEFVRERFGLPR